MPFVARVVQIYLAANFQQASFLATSAQLFRSFLDQQGLFVFLLIVGASGAIADDRRANALQVYLSKPLTRVEYIAGKLFAPLAFVLGVTLLPALLLLVVHVAFSGSLTFVVQNLYLLPAIVLYSVTLALLGTFTMVALSSLSKSRRFTALTFTGPVLLHHGDVPGAAAHHRQPAVGADLAARPAGRDRRRRLPDSRAARAAGVGGAARPWRS